MATKKTSLKSLNVKSKRQGERPVSMASTEARTVKPASTFALMASSRAMASAPTARTAASKRGPPPLRYCARELEAAVDNDPKLAKKVSQLERNITFSVTPKTLSGERLQAARGLLHNTPLDPYRPRPDAREAAVERLQQLGLKVLHVGRFAITAQGPAELVADVVKAPLIIQTRPRPRDVRGLSSLAQQPLPSINDLFISPENLSIPSKVSENIDDFVFTPPPLFFTAPSATPPTLGYKHLDIANLRRLLKVPAQQETGKGISVAVVDTGFYKHPFYTAGGYAYRAVPAPGAASGSEWVDDEGHGTAIAMNVFAVAPGVELAGVKYEGTPDAAFETALETGARIVSCSWGWDREQVFPILEATIRDAIVTDGIIVLFASGNGHYAWPGSMPEVISIGGVYAAPDNNYALEASNYASGYMSALYSARCIPDVSGLCGQSPRAIYIPMPTQPGCLMDKQYGGKPFPDFDGTKGSDGWVVASGTSSATPQIAGVIALLLERATNKGVKLTPERVRQLLQETATPVSQGRNALGFPASGHPNVACGFGLVNTELALSKI
ncbi:S8 family serine peptidase [Archangium sp.]|uniref:S8 family serine peptidase n=1 Tax=Archangium sp. TaxID=1872627 RepID=UPI00286C78A1|nr:S8 family serine peptidase [Archangium sp.]